MSLGEYRGEERLVIGMDLGTTMSAVSYSHLRDGESPRVHLIMKWPGQPAAAGDCKIPTLVRYDGDGKALLFGRAAQMNEANLKDTYLAKWFKLWLHPSSMRTKFHLTPPPLPPKVAIRDIYADFLGFVFTHTRKSLEDTIGGNARDSLWTRFESTFVLCLAIPNGWDAAQQGVLREAVVQSGIMSLEDAMSRLTFVTEAEASVHFAIAHADIASWLRKDGMFLVTDAGGSTVDTVVYKCTSVAPALTLEEATSSECVQAGSAVIDQAAEQLFQRKMHQSQFDDPETLETILNDFEQNAKREYDGSGDGAVIKTGTNFTDKTRNVTKGRIRLLRDEIEEVFAGPLNEIALSIDRAVRRAGQKGEGALKLLTVGGFAESPRLRSFLKERLASHDIELITVDEPTKKAAAEGAAYWYAKKFVVARAARKSYGVMCAKRYDSSLPEHQARSHKVCTVIDGTEFIPDHFSRLVAKNEIVQNNASSRISYWRLSPTKPDFTSFQVNLHCIDDEKPPYWYTEDNGKMLPGFDHACTLKADMSGFERTLKPHTDPVTLKTYWRIDFAVEVFFGQTMLCAAVTWEEDSQARKGPVTVIANSIQ
ncbi:hypothetical protein BKA62DRAFT_310726 [Auriculariales sp. MPI-PUGE-AT-0066]|nr:hypothetical protein BKA62DRAFT_310726 [Auriculariales sp. MPI-PUGE-AT-0066]